MALDLSKEAGLLLEEMGRLRSFFPSPRDPIAFAAAAERLYAVFVHAETVLNAAGPIVVAHPEQQWGYRLLSSHIEMARQMLTRPGIPTDIAERVRSGVAYS